MLVVSLWCLLDTNIVSEPLRPQPTWGWRAAFPFRGEIRQAS